ncbi:hypothetical protein FHG87_024022 [Trinorchestia longiramus]|nr:hypothetical protein FHG87_024022 [Trinorchestia longiramus]
MLLHLMDKKLAHQSHSTSDEMIHYQASDLTHVTSGVCGESHGYTSNEYCDEASFHRPMSRQDTEVNPATRLVPVTTRNRTLTNERSPSGIRAQPTALYNEAATLCATDSLPSAFKVNIPTMNSHHLKKSTYNQQQSERSKNQPSCWQTEQDGCPTDRMARRAQRRTKN